MSEKKIDEVTLEQGQGVVLDPDAIPVPEVEGADEEDGE